MKLKERVENLGPIEILVIGTFFVVLVTFAIMFDNMSPAAKRRTVTAYTDTGHMLGRWSGNVEVMKFDDGAARVSVDGEAIYITGGIVILEEDEL